MLSSLRGSHAPRFNHENLSWRSSRRTRPGSQSPDQRRDNALGYWLDQGRGDPHAHAKKPAKKALAKLPKPQKRIVQTLNVNAPGKTYPRDADKNEAARRAFLKVLPKSGPGVTQAQMMALMKNELPASEWGTTEGWWAKTAQLDAEARCEVIRDGGKPLRWKLKK